jgi:hypothetical protein
MQQLSPKEEQAVKTATSRHLKACQTASQVPGFQDFFLKELTPELNKAVGKPEPKPTS